MKRRPTHIPHIPGQRRRGVNVPDLSKGRRISSPMARVSRRGESWSENRSRPRNKKKPKSGCGFPFWLVILAFIGWNMVGKDADWSWILDEMRQAEQVSDAPASEVEQTETPPITQLPPPPTIGEPEAAPPPVIGPTPPRGDLSSLFTAEDYPSSALRNDEEGIVRTRLIVGTDGQVRECTVVRSSGSSALDEATCDIFIRRARFEPARDASGDAVEGSIVTPAIRWVIP